MCGICGLFNHDPARPVAEEVLASMTAVLEHRGPDDSGMHCEGPVGLGFRRLSIVDLSAGHQPMTNEDGTLWIVFNGEIYNHLDIRKDLEARGHRYRTRADTETILHLYEEEGVEGFSRMIGMFAFAIWDGPLRRLVLARDRLGIKPLHYAEVNGGLAFASEVKALLRHPEVSARLDSDSVHEFLTFRYVAGEKSLFQGIRNLLPGHLLICEGGTVKDRTFWDVGLQAADPALTEESALEELEERLSDSVRLRLMSDVPLGTFCSGGVDSGLTTALARRYHDAELNTFSVGFHEPAWDETHFAEKVSTRYGTRHHVIRVDAATYADSLPRLIWYHDDPLYHPSSVLIYHVSRLARQHVTVVLTGEGADELFGGYPRFLIPRAIGKVRWIPKGVRRIVAAGLEHLPGHRGRKLAQTLPLSLKEAVLFNAAYTPPARVTALLRNPWPEDALAHRLSFLRDLEAGGDRSVERAMLLDLKVYIPSLLHRQDKMSMAASIESRVPFLDHRLVEWAGRVPLSLKIRGVQNKYIVKKLGEKYLPHEAIYRQKSGFGVPVAEWLRNPEGLGRFLPLLEGGKAEIGHLFREEKLAEYVREHREGKRNHAELLWSLLNLELWHRIFVSGNMAVEPFPILAAGRSGKA